MVYRYFPDPEEISGSDLMAEDKGTKVCIYIVYHGAKYGLLIEKRSLTNFEHKKAYFYLVGDSAQGLEPTPEIINICGSDCYPIPDRETNIRNTLAICSNWDR